MKPVSEMSAVELLSEFHVRVDYMTHVRKAREQGSEIYTPARGRGAYLVLTRTGQPPLEVAVPRPEIDERWDALCAEINRRFDPPPRKES